MIEDKEESNCVTIEELRRQLTIRDEIIKKKEIRDLEGEIRRLEKNSSETEKNCIEKAMEQTHLDMQGLLVMLQQVQFNTAPIEYLHSQLSPYAGGVSTIRGTFTEISKLDRESSRFIKAAGLEWEIDLSILNEDKTKYLSAYLACRPSRPTRKSSCFTNKFKYYALAGPAVLHTLSNCCPTE
ncbi:hypothetical protein PMAYCL1PPCAC_25029 [Pristionchus mayeri]|uniref:MATH domain-containing protein n=1 Tax=Pristionchus mayeri TaxID=1317129 RepID=A0AAN5D397_9BILA|nr:hypothetical protein PMAYCL1PPCAC_25029 [Pristionchus mayeri]